MPKRQTCKCEINYFNFELNEIIESSSSLKIWRISFLHLISASNPFFFTSFSYGLQWCFSRLLLNVTEFLCFGMRFNLRFYAQCFWPFDNVPSEWQCARLLLWMWYEIWRDARKNSYYKFCWYCWLWQIDRELFHHSLSKVWAKVGKWILPAIEKCLTNKKWTAHSDTHTHKQHTHNFKSNEEKVFIRFFLSFVLYNPEFVL